MSEMTTGSLKAVFRFPFRGSDWQSRFLTGMALIIAGFLVPIVPGILVGGYALRVMRQAIEGEALSLPAWDDWGELAMDGLRSMLVSLVYLGPGVVVFYGGVALYFIASVAAPLAAFAGDPEDTVGIVMLLLFGSLAIMMLSVFVGWALLVAGGIPLPVVRAHFVARDEVAAAFRVGEWWPLLRVNKLGYFIVWVLLAGLGMLVGLLITVIYYSVVLCCAIPFLMAPLAFYLSLVSAALFGLAYRESVALLRAEGE